MRHHKKIPHHLDVMRDLLAIGQSDQFLRTTGFEAVEHAGLGDGHLQEVHHRAGEHRRRKWQEAIR